MSAEVPEPMGHEPPAGELLLAFDTDDPEFIRGFEL
jgi:hypothetical protein